QKTILQFPYHDTINNSEFDVLITIDPVVGPSLGAADHGLEMNSPEKLSQKVTAILRMFP
ncbi:MAG: hypothetical protein WCF33_08355, partial [Pseudonocardiaceae bacterium]